MESLEAAAAVESLEAAAAVESLGGVTPRLRAIAKTPSKAAEATK